RPLDSSTGGALPEFRTERSFYGYRRSPLEGYVAPPGDPYAHQSSDTHWVLQGRDNRLGPEPDFGLLRPAAEGGGRGLRADFCPTAAHGGLHSESQWAANAELGPPAGAGGGARNYASAQGN